MILSTLKKGFQNIAHLFHVYTESRRSRFILVLLLVGVFLFIYTFRYRTPEEFPSHSLITVAEGETLQSIALRLYEEHAVFSPFWFKSIVILLGSGKPILSGDYFFGKPLGLIPLSERMLLGEFGLTAIRVTIPEGSSVNQIAELIPKEFIYFDKDEFRALATPKEGSLFPDTYFFLPNVRAKDVVSAMESNFDQKMKGFEKDIVDSGRPLKEIITMASILEEEARLYETRQMVAGILWKRIEIGMPLQVDSVFPYIFGKNHFPVSLEDLKFESPYNTYLHRGLPPGPISSPGLISIAAAMNPIESKYLYYLTDRNGVMHYAVMHEEHVANKAKYLR